MTVSSEDAIRLLSKWASEPSNVFVFVKGDPFVIRLLGSLSIVLDPPCLSIYQPGPQLRRTDIAFGLADASDFDYSDLREAPDVVKQEMGDWLTAGLSFSIGANRINIYELAE